MTEVIEQPMVARRMSFDKVLLLSNSEKEIDLYSWAHRGVMAPGVEALAEITGFGLADVNIRWSEGAGDGATYQGGRVLPRTIEIPLFVRSDDRAGLNRLISDIATVLNPRKGLATLSYMLPDGEMWYVKVARIGGGDWARIAESDNRTWIRLPLLLKAGDPYWTRARAENFSVRVSETLHTWLPMMANIMLNAGSAFGTRLVTNEGDSDAYPIWEAKGPLDELTLIGPEGQILRWTDSLALGESLFIDVKRGTVRDNHGVNRYNALAPNPRFWTIEPGTSEVGVLVEGSSAGQVVNGVRVDFTEVICSWQPRRWAVV